MNVGRLFLGNATRSRVTAMSNTRKRVSSCALAALTIFVSNSSCSSWTSESQVSQFKSFSSTTFAMSSSSANTCESTFTVAQFPCLSDNYGYLIHDHTTGQTAAIDTPCTDSYVAELKRRGWTLTHILNTHHHWDHVGGNMDLKTEGVQVFGPASERIPGIDRPLNAGDVVGVGNLKATVMDVGGHTTGHIAFYFPDQSLAFVGDALFTLGCGRMFEGTPSQFWASLQRIRDLPDDTLVYCAHEYTISNGKFAISVEPNNPDLVDQIADAKAKRERGEPTVPTVIGIEKKTNPFLRVDVSDEIRKNVGVAANDSDEMAFAKVRKAKDIF